MNITNFTDKELAAYEEYKAFRSGHWSARRTVEEIVGSAALIACAVALVLV